MAKNPLQKISDYGQSIWLDYIRRKLLDSGELKKMIEEDGLRGVTVNPSILEKAISGSHDYDSAIQALALEGKSEPEIYERLGVEDVQRAADLFRPLYEESQGKHGFVSLEVSPYLAHDAEGTIAEARRFWKELDRPNVFIKVPATGEGLTAIRELIREGINVNVTLLFGLPRYREVAEAYIAGLEARVDQGEPVDRIASVASFFLSRIDVLVDPMLEEKMNSSGRQAETAEKSHGQVAVASARIAYQIYKEIFASDRFKRLAEKGARTQRLLWASTSTKNPAYSDVKYVEALIGPETVNTAPPETLDAYRDHGEPAARIEEDLDKAREVLDKLPELDIDIDEVTQQLEDEGVDKFAVSYDRLMDTLKKERQHALEEPVDRQSLSLGKYESSVKKTADQLEQQAFITRLWRKDPSLWKKDPVEQEVIRNALGWLHVAEKMEENLDILNAFRDEVKQAGFKHAVHMGMGGSSLAPLVFERTFALSQKGIPVTVLDTTDPQTILKIEKEIPIEDTLFIVASKSGTTAEPLAFCDYFYDKVREIKGDQAGKNFIAITDPGTPLVKLAQKRNFRRTFLNYADIGGRYSALSYFGLLPATLMGVDVGELLARALRMVHACVSCVDAENNPGLQLGVALGEIARQGRDKVTFLVPESISTLGMWLEQLLAESTGKEGQGMLPVAGEQLGDPDVYGDDRFFAYFRLGGQVDEDFENRVKALKEAGHPVVTIQMDDRLDLGQEFFRWEIATATAGAVLGINAFNQPNVQESKEYTNRLLKKVREDGKLPKQEPLIKETPLSLYANEKKASTIADLIAEFLDQAEAGDYIDLMAYLPETAENERELEEIRIQLRDGLQIASTLGYGPRFLHSTGQYHKGGPNTGIFLQLTVDEPKDAQIPDQPYTFGMLQRAQALGDLEALHKHNRRAFRIHLGNDANQGLQALKKVVLSAIAVH